MKYRNPDAIRMRVQHWGIEPQIMYGSWFPYNKSPDYWDHSVCWHTQKDSARW